MNSNQANPASCGILYVASGAPHVKAAIRSARSAKHYSPDLPIRLFADPPGVEAARACAGTLFESVRPIENPHRRSKVDYMPQTPFDKTLYLDCDTQVCDDIRDMFDVLDRFDLAMCHAHTRNTLKNQQPWTLELPYAFPQFNAGVIAYRKTPAVIRFLESWKEAYHSQSFQKDQVTLRELIWQSDLRIATLPPEYNIRYRKYLWIWTGREARPKILHYPRFRPGVIARGFRKIKTLLSGGS